MNVFGHCAKAAGDFHLGLNHARVALAQIVGEGNFEVVEKAQDVAPELVQPVQEIVSRSKRRSAARAHGALATSAVICAVTPAHALPTPFPR